MHHSREKHINVKYHFIRDQVLKGDIEFSFVSTDFQIAIFLPNFIVKKDFVLLENFLVLLQN